MCSMHTHTSFDWAAMMCLNGVLVPIRRGWCDVGLTQIDGRMLDVLTMARSGMCGNNEKGA